MKISQITLDNVMEFLRLDPEDCQEGLHYTGMTEKEADEKEDFYIAYMVLCQDMYDNRSMYADKGSVQGGNVNKVVESVLGMHCRNLL